MKEVKNNKKPFIFYYAVVILIMILLNLFLFPKLLSPTVTEVGYDTFLSMLEEKQVQEVQLDQQENQIIFSDKSDPVNYYETGIFPDPDLLTRLQDAGVEGGYGTQIIEQVSPWMSLLMSLVPFIILIAIGQLMMRSVTKKMGGAMGNAMTFGKSNAKIYVESTTGIRFSDVAGEDEAKEILQEDVYKRQDQHRLRVCHSGSGRGTGNTHCRQGGLMLS